MSVVWLWIQSDCNVGGGGSEIKAYSSAEQAIAANPGSWEIVDDGMYRNKDANYYDPETIERFEIDSEEAIA